GRGSAAAANDVEPALTGEILQNCRHFAGRLIVAAKCVREPGVWVATDGATRQVGKLFDIRAHFAGTELAVDPDGERASMTDRIPESLDRLARERPSGSVGNRHGEPDGKADAGFFKKFLQGENRGLEVERVEGRFGEEQIDA